MKCEFEYCENESRKNLRYCSNRCIKRVWYLKNRGCAFFTDKEKFATTETGIGFKWEKFGATLLGAKHLPFNNRGLDLDWNGKMIDVKSAKLNFRKNKRGKPVASEQKGYWAFHSWGKNKPDFFLCIALVEDKAFRTYLIPASKYPISGVSIGWKSKYDKYLFSPPGYPIGA